MYTSIRAELQKARRRDDLIVCLLVPVMALLWCQSAAPTGADELASAYSALFYSLPIINTILMPLAMAILASRLWDVEVKGCTPKLLYTLQSRRSLFAAKAALGLAEIFLIVTLEAAGAPLIGHLQHYTQPYPAAGQAAYLWGCTFAVDCMIFFSELLLTVLLANPLPALCVGILGTLLGLFSAFMPAWVGYFVPWGYFIPLNTYRIADWDQASKVVTYMIVPFRWAAAGCHGGFGRYFVFCRVVCHAEQGGVTHANRPRCIRAENRKLHASPIWFTFFILPTHFRRVRNLQLPAKP